MYKDSTFARLDKMHGQISGVFSIKYTISVLLFMNSKFKSLQNDIFILFNVMCFWYI